jgi:hypothetical protein
MSEDNNKPSKIKTATIGDVTVKTDYDTSAIQVNEKKRDR